MVSIESRFFPDLSVSGDKLSHRRHITPCDYNNKLKPDTIKQLDEIFADTLDVLGYDKWDGMVADNQKADDVESLSRLVINRDNKLKEAKASQS